MDELISALAQFMAWLFGQPTAVQVVVGLGILAASYPLLVILRVLIAALYGAFRGLG